MNSFLQELSWKKSESQMGMRGWEEKKKKHSSHNNNHEALEEIASRGCAVSTVKSF